MKYCICSNQMRLTGRKQICLQLQYCVCVKVLQADGNGTWSTSSRGESSPTLWPDTWAIAAGGGVGGLSEKPEHGEREGGGWNQSSWREKKRERTLLNGKDRGRLVTLTARVEVNLLLISFFLSPFLNFFLYVCPPPLFFFTSRSLVTCKYTINRIEHIKIACQ